MKKYFGLFGIALLAGLVLVPECFAQRGGGRGWGVGDPYNRMYDVTTLETISGQITDIQAMAPMRRMSPGIHAVVKTDTETITVHLGPAWFLNYQEVQLEKGDRIEVTGSRIVFAGQPAIIAASVRLGDQILRLRDDSGFPVWSGWRRWPVG